MQKVLKRLSEPSSYAGLAAILIGLNDLFNLHGVPEAAAALATAGKAVAGGASPIVAVATAVLGTIAILKPERGKK